jgi:DHA2 family methylenomycin A resistance protein-like MFS transporter
VVPLMAISAGISFAMPAATAAVVEAAGAGQVGVASGALNASRQVGGALGIAVLGACVSGTGKGLALSLVLAAAAYLGGAVAASLVPHRSRPRPGERPAADRQVTSRA